MIKLQLPLKKEEIATLRAGDEVLLTGPVYTGRDAAHKRLTEAMARVKAERDEEGNKLSIAATRSKYTHKPATST